LPKKEGVGKADGLEADHRPSMATTRVQLSPAKRMRAEGSEDQDKLADPREMQRQLFHELSQMFADEVPLYGAALAVNRVCNRTAASLLETIHQGLRLSDKVLEQTSAERHGAIRIGTAEEYRWISRFFAVFAMEPHDFYDMTNLGTKSQPIIATAFRSQTQPENRMFTSLLTTSYFDDATRQRIEARLAQRQIISVRARELIERNETQGGLVTKDAEELIQEARRQIFKWSGHGHHRELYENLCKAGFNIAADIACFDTHHLNHLTPNTLCIDLYTCAMRYCLGEICESELRMQAAAALQQQGQMADSAMLRLLFRHLTHDDASKFRFTELKPGVVDELVDDLVRCLAQEQFALQRLPHNGFKDQIEGPAAEAPVLLRQTSYKALKEAVCFREQDGTEKQATHSARFGEIEQRGYATTVDGRALYDRCLALATKAQAEARSQKEAAAAYAEAFKSFPSTLDSLCEQGLVFASYVPSATGLAAKGTIQEIDIDKLVQAGYAHREPQRYEDFLPFSAAGIFASNLKQYGTTCTAAQKPTFTKQSLEEVLGRGVVDPASLCRQAEQESVQHVLQALGIAGAGAIK